MSFARLTLLLVAALGLLAGCGAPEPGPLDVGRELRRARRYADVLVREAGSAGDSTAVPPGDAVALGYLERLRTGMGSPFRLAEEALRDPRLPGEERTRLAWALLAWTLDGEGYRVDPAALDPVGWGGDRLARRGGADHLALIEEAVSEGSDPRTGELAVRMAYAMAAAERTVGPGAPTLTTWAAALLRDRHLAREDARDLLRAAREARVSPLLLLPAWRSARRFRVEAPVLLPPGPEVEREAVRTVPRLMAGIRPPLAPAAEERRTQAQPAGVLGAGAAARLAGEGARLDLPPQAAVVGTLHAYRKYLFPGEVPVDSADPRLRLLRGGWNEERFAAEYALLRASGRGGAPAASVALGVAVALRSRAQEAVWFPGLPAPAARDLRTRYGLASVSFHDSVPEGWRPYYLRALDEGLRDLRRVFPGMDLKGLRIRFGPLGRSDALATHSPDTRTITLPPETGAGTLAHEVAHELDRQAARKRYGVRSTYRTDRAVRLRRDHLAAALRELAPGPLEAPAPGAAEASFQRRPAEVFARNVDWFVAAALAREGLSNGYLSAVQDRALTGYASAAPPAADGRTGEAVVRILDEVAPAPGELRRWFLEQYGSGRPPSTLAVVEEVLGSPLPDPEAVPRAGPRRPFGGDGRLDRCGLVGWEAVLGEDPTHREAAEMAARARARGVALEQAERLAGVEGREWMARQLGGRLWSPLPVDSATVELLDPLVRSAAPGAEPPFGAPPRACGPMGGDGVLVPPEREGVPVAVSGLRGLLGRQAQP